MALWLTKVKGKPYGRAVASNATPRKLMLLLNGKLLKRYNPETGASA